MAGVARIISDPYNVSAEFAVVEPDAWQGKGIGNALTDHVLNIARLRQLKTITAEFLPDNHAIRHLLEKRGFKTKTDSEVYSAGMRLP